METQECLDNCDKAMIAEGVPDQERQERLDILKEVIETAETTSAKIKAIKEARAAKRNKPRVTIRETIEWCLVTFMAGMLAGSLLYQYAEAHQ